ncbi:unnamed protein product [Boreogadus saida]
MNVALPTDGHGDDPIERERATRKEEGRPWGTRRADQQHGNKTKELHWRGRSEQNAEGVVCTASQGGALIYTYTLKKTKIQKKTERIIKNKNNSNNNVDDDGG